MCFRGSLALVFCAQAFAAEIGVVEEIVAKVNGDIITRTELERTQKQAETELRQRPPKGIDINKELAERRKLLLSDKIDQLLLVQRGRELNINIDGEVSKQVADIQRATGIADPEKFQSYVREQTGQSYEDWRQDMKNSFLTRRVIGQEVSRNIQIPRATVREYYDKHPDEFKREESVFLREILVSTENKDAAGVAAAEKKARDLVARARKGEKFHELAREHSDADSKSNYGELGLFKKGEISKAIEQIVFNAERNAVTDPIRVEKGFLILKVEERYKAGLAPFEEVEDQIMNMLYQPKMQPAVREYLTKLRRDAFLEIKEGYVDVNAAPGKVTKWSDPGQLKPETVTKQEVANKKRRKRLLGIVPMPGTNASGEGTSKSR
ncbi:MAG TPA: peptidyl-prolyl cis-trans isomerase [Bryobacteraceae bacterium]|jgi:parvulin-like peptidyl-prolyl isomerase|nr:peptidyl-prolyl cis-trans isomerase [Bryobacteraceae bacterium]